MRAPAAAPEATSFEEIFEEPELGRRRSADLRRTLGPALERYAPQVERRIVSKTAGKINRASYAQKLLGKHQDLRDLAADFQAAEAGAVEAARKTASPREPDAAPRGGPSSIGDLVASAAAKHAARVAPEQPRALS